MKTPSNTKMSFTALLLTITVSLLLPIKVSGWGWKQPDPTRLARDCTRKISREAENISDLLSDPRPDKITEFVNSVSTELTTSCLMIPSGSFKTNQQACGNASNLASNSLDDLEATLGNTQQSKVMLSKVRYALNAVVKSCDNNLME